MPDFLFSLTFETEVLTIQKGKPENFAPSPRFVPWPCNWQENVAHLPWSTQLMETCSRLKSFLRLNPNIPTDTFCQRPGPGWPRQHQSGQKEEGFDHLEETEAGKEKPRAKIWEDRQWETLLLPSVLSRGH